jgi:hypothetical protein
MYAFSWILFWLLIISSKSALLANDSAITGIGGSIQPMSSHPSIVMQSEKVEIKLTSNKIFAKTTFVFYNSGKPINVKMGFPEQGWGDVQNPEFASFRAFVDGKPLKVQTTPWKANDPNWHRWRVKTIFFKQGQTRVVTNYYTARPGESVDGTKFVNYVMTTGSSWKGPIGKADIVIDIFGVKDYQTIKPKPEGYQRTDRFIKWHFTNFEPDFNIEVRYAWGYLDFIANGQAVEPYIGGLYSKPWAPRIESGVLMVPAVILPQLMGGEVHYDNVNDKLVYRLPKLEKEVSISIPGKKAVANGYTFELTREARFIKGRVMVPLASIARLVGIDVRYDPLTHKTHISYPASFN